MLTIRRALSALLVGAGLLTLGWWACTAFTAEDWARVWALAWVLILVPLIMWSFVGVIVRVDSTLGGPRWMRTAIGGGPLVWLWLLLVAPWTTNADDGPEGF